MTSGRAHGVALLAVLSIGCSSVTEVVVVVDSDLSVPAELDSIRIDVTSPGGEFRRASAPLLGARAMPLPRTLGIVYRGGPLEPLVVVATGTLNGRDVVQRRARLAFAPGRIVELRLDLFRSCVDVACTIDQTCTEQACTSSEVSVARLSDWNGTRSGMDASVPRDGGDAGDGGARDACVVMVELCNGRDDDCDGLIDEDFNLTSDPTHCGSCTRVCARAANASPRCERSACALTCDPGWADCDTQPANGCEAPLSLPSTCGACTARCSGTTPFCSGSAASGFRCTATCAPPMTACGGSCVDLATSSAHCGTCDGACRPIPGATPRCALGACGFVCNPGFYDCNGIPADGCESTLRTLANCGACGVTCNLAHAVASCSAGTCARVACEAGWAHCRASVADGCETRLDVDPAHCGNCTNACPVSPPNAVSTCVAGLCALVCNPAWADCNRMPSDGCEAALSSPATCGSCGIRCDGPAPLCATDATGAHLCVAGCRPGEVLCSGTCASTSTDPRNCGSCATACPSYAHASPACAAAVCGFTCDPGWADCDRMPANGCEASLASLSSCGACGSVCALAHATPTCATRTCAIASCDPGWGDCDALPANGCETSLASSPNCGACGNVCPTSAPNASGSACTAGACVLTCSPGWANCDGLLSNGCETSLITLTNCGACGVTCARARASATCSTSACRIAACDPGWGNCDGLDANGCERSLTTFADCGACGAACDVAATSCTAGTCVCPSPLVASGTECVDTSRDPRNCGAVGALCSNDDQYCVAGSCVCRPGLTPLVAGGCVDLATDPANCGVVGGACGGATPRCASGTCVASCPAGTTVCGRACVHLESDPVNCGTCGSACALQQICVASRCESFRSAAGCTLCPCAARCGGLRYPSCCTYPMTADLVCVNAPTCS